MQQRHATPGFREALAGSLVGTVLGGTLGVLLVNAALNDDAWAGQDCNDDRTDVRRDSGECALIRLGVGAAGVALAAGGGPYGAARGLSAGGAGVYAPSVAGELLLGGAGYALGAHLSGGGSRGLLGGLIAGVPLAALGAAGGAVLGLAESQRPAGGVRFREGRWALGAPHVQVHPSFDARPAVRVTLVSARF